MSETVRTEAANAAQTLKFIYCTFPSRRLELLWLPANPKPTSKVSHSCSLTGRSMLEEEVEIIPLACFSGLGKAMTVERFVCLRGYAKNKQIHPDLERWRQLEDVSK
ncbi:hypothetical protein OCU04_009960 [Sclerotinia nivalis]|uniref:Uncharacterized protein n=1 Tax=Sclerotinia nivalis TaxID=352851 RepID=A0A9X0AEH0_9HELO|nr:hypothetical protein OCU04_009960 [Sclerotinia nivalis]